MKMARTVAHGVFKYAAAETETIMIDQARAQWNRNAPAAGRMNSCNCRLISAGTPERLTLIGETRGAPTSYRIGSFRCSVITMCKLLQIYSQSRHSNRAR